MSKEPAWSLAHGEPLHSPHTLSRTASQEYVFPPLTHPSRQASLRSSIFSLVSTIIGGGVLSLPYAFSQCGLVFSLLLLALIALASDFSIYILISASRRQQSSTSYPSLIRCTFGPRAATLTLALLFALVYTAVVAYLILLRDMVAPLVDWLSPVDLDLTARGDRLCFLLVVAALTPLCLLRSLHGLRYASVLSIATVCALAVVIVTKACRSSAAIATLPLSAFAYPPSLSSLLSCAPIMVNTFLCHFNVLPVHSALTLPTRRRIHALVHAVVLLSFVLYATVGSAGFLLYGQAVDANIMNNMRSTAEDDGSGGDESSLAERRESNWVRLGLVITLCCNLPLLVLPCRDTAMQLMGWAKGADDALQPASERQQQEADESGAEDSPLMDEETPLVAQMHSITSSNGSNGHSHYSAQLAPTPSASTPAASDSSASASTVAPTLLIIGSSLVLSLLIPSVALLWSMLGSTVSIWVAFTLPSLAYLRVRRRKAWTARWCGSLLLLCVSAVMCTVCGWTAWQRVSSGRDEQVLEVGGRSIDQ